MSTTEPVETKKGAKTKKNAQVNEALKLDQQNDVEPKVAPKKRKRKVIKQTNNSKNPDGTLMIKNPGKRKYRKMSNNVAPAEGSFGTENKQTVKPKPRKRKNSVQIKEEPMENLEDLNLTETINWPPQDLSDLIKRMEAALPDKDNMSFSTRAEKLNWDDIAFKDHGGEECKKVWLLIQKRLRRFRLLREVLQDAKEWIAKPWTNFYRGTKTQRHPDMPRRPLSVYMLFYLKKKDKILSENPGLEMTELSKKIALMYKTIPPAKKEKYMQMAEDERKSYDGKLDEFYRIHPEISRNVDKPGRQPKPETGPKRPLTPFVLYYQEQLKHFTSSSEIDRSTYKEQCKEQWKNLSDKKKVVWIDWALDKEAKYQDEVKNYSSQNPDFTPITLKPILNKDEKSLKERLAGKPLKPPGSAYSLFSKMMLQSEEIKKIGHQDRMKVIAEQWKNCSEEEKKQYRERLEHMMEQFKLDFASYLESLSEEKRQEELQNNLPKRKTKSVPAENGEKAAPKKKRKPNPKKAEETALMKIFDAEPAQPPVSGFALFSKRYHGKAPVETAWKNLNKMEKKEYEVEVQKLKQKYIKEYEKFLKSLTKEQLTAFSQLKRKRDSMAMNDGNNEKSEESSNCDSDSEAESNVSADQE